MKVRFLADPEVRITGKNEWELLNDFPCEIWREGETPRIIKVHKGTKTDLASVPRLPLAYMLFGGKARRSAILHDWLYRIQWPRKEADEIFRAAMENEVGAFTRWAMWLGVRVGGAGAYADKEKLPADDRNF